MFLFHLKGKGFCAFNRFNQYFVDLRPFFSFILVKISILSKQFETQITHFVCECMFLLVIAYKILTCN